jgi:hypothetical protein
MRHYAVNARVIDVETGCDDTHCKVTICDNSDGHAGGVDHNQASRAALMHAFGSDANALLGRCDVHVTLTDSANRHSFSPY